MTIALCVLGFVLVCAAVAAVKITWEIKSTVVETLSATAAPFAATGAAKVTHSALNVSKVLDANSAAGTNVTKVVHGTITLTAGAATLNLASVHGTEGTEDLTGLKIRTVQFMAKAANANPITIAKGAANGYTGLGAAFSLTLDPAKSVGLEANATAVAAGVRTLDVSGTGTQAVDFIITAGSN